MSEYKGIKGFQVQTRTEDPVPFAQQLADNPYAGSWSSGGALNTARYSLGGAGTQTAGIVFGGAAPRKTQTEVYNGSSWTEVADLASARNEGSGAGTSTAALYAGGRLDPAASAITESWDGSSWTEVGDLNQARESMAATGVGATNTAMIVQGGYPDRANVESWNGSSWTEIAELNANREVAAGAGTSTSGMFIGGKTPSANYATAVEKWNGSAWTETGDLNTGRTRQGAAGTSNTVVLVYGGESGASPDYTGATESWDGSSWTEVNDMATSRYGLAGGGGAMPYTVALASAGYTTAGTAFTEEWAFSGVQPGDEASYSDAITGDFYYNSTTGQFKNVVLGTKGWSSGGDLPTGRYRTKAMGTQTATLAALGSDPSAYNNTSLHYDGSSWTESQALNRAPGVAGGAGGTQTAAIIGGGYNSGGPSPNSKTTETEIYNGTSWTEVNNTNTGRSGNTGTGSTTAAIIFGGATSVVSPSHPAKAVTAATETWDGTNWTEVGDLNTARESLAGSGTTNPYTTALAFGGTKAPYPPGTRTGETELWNGSAWTEVADLNTSREIESGGAGDSGTSALAFGGYTSTAVANTEEWDGTSWTEVADLATARYGIGGTGTGTTAICVSGGPGNITATEEFSQPAFDIKTVTTS